MTVEQLINILNKANKDSKIEIMTCTPDKDSVVGFKFTEYNFARNDITIGDDSVIFTLTKFDN